MEKPISLNINYETQKATITYVSNDGPEFLESGVVEKTFDMDDDRVLEAHEFCKNNAITEASKLAVKLEIGDGEKES